MAHQPEWPSPLYVAGTPSVSRDHNSPNAAYRDILDALHMGKCDGLRLTPQQCYDVLAVLEAMNPNATAGNAEAILGICHDCSAHEKVYCKDCAMEHVEVDVDKEWY